MNSDELIKGLKFDVNGVYFNSHFFPFLNGIEPNNAKDIKKGFDKLLRDNPTELSNENKQVLDRIYGLSRLVEESKEHTEFEILIKDRIGLPFYPYDMETYMLYAIIPTTLPAQALSESLKLIVEAKLKDEAKVYIFGDYLINRLFNFHRLFNNKYYKSLINDSFLDFLDTPIGKMAYLFGIHSILENDPEVRKYYPEIPGKELVLSSFFDQTGFPFHKYILAYSQPDLIERKAYEKTLAKALLKSLYHQGVIFPSNSSMKAIIGGILYVNELYDPTTYLDGKPKGALMENLRSHFHYLESTYKALQAQQAS